MTKEQAVEVLRCNTNLGYGIVIENESIQLIKEAIEMAIKALEQQPCGDCENNDGEYCRLLFEKSFNKDCVSRQAVAEIINRQRFGIHQISMGIIKEKIESLPPVTPTHGTCKDCKSFCCPNGIMPTCIKCFRSVTEDFYCADFEKRGSENG